MSIYSNKCDFADSLEIHKYTLEELRNNVEIYIGSNQKPLRIEKMSDVIPYYPYIVGSACFDNKKRKAIIHLSSESFVDREEREILEFKLKHILKIYNNYKRKNIEFNVEDIVKKICWMNWNVEAMTELVNRVKLHGKKATINGIHLTMHEYCRKKLVEEMIENGLDPSEYGYDRFVRSE